MKSTILSRQFLTISFILFYFSSIAQKENIREIINKRFEYMNHHNVVQIASLYDDSVKIQSPNFEGFKTGREGVTNIFARYFISSPDLSYSITRMMICDSFAVIEFTSKGTIDSAATEVPAFMKGKSYTLQNCTLLDFRNGKIFKEFDYFDQVSFLRQMDYFNQQH